MPLNLAIKVTIPSSRSITALSLKPKNTNFPIFRTKSMQQMRESKATMEGSEESRGVRIRERKVREVVEGKQRQGVVEVGCTASLAEAMGVLVRNSVAGVAVVAPPGEWIGAGGSMIVEAERGTGDARKHYIGMVTVLDMVAHIAGGDRMSLEGDGIEELEEKMKVPVSSIIGQSIEGLALWTLNPNTSLLDCMEVFSKGVHRALVPLDSHIENNASESSSSGGGIELVESSSSYHMLTQMDLLKFLNHHYHHHHHDASELQSIMSRSVQDLGADTHKVYAITELTTLVDAIKCLKASMLSAVPIVAASEVGRDDHKQLINGRCRKLIGSFSANDLRRCDFDTLKSWLGKTALSFTEEIVARSSGNNDDDTGTSRRELVTCQAETPLSEVIEKAVTKHVHKVWETDQEGLILGIVSLSDIFRVLRASLMADYQRDTYGM